MSLIRAHHLWIAAFIALTIGKNKLQLCLLLLLPLEKYSSGPCSDINAVKKIRLTFFSLTNVMHLSLRRIPYDDLRRVDRSIWVTNVPFCVF